MDVSSAATGAITNTASVAGGNDGDTTNNDGSDTINVSAQADVGITKTLTPAAPVAGDQATYRLVVTNHGPSTATGVIVSDPLPAGLIDPTVTTSGGTCDITAGTLNCTIPSIANAGFEVITVAGTIDPAASGQTLSNTAQVSANEPDPNSANNTDTATGTVTGEADLSLEKTMTPVQPLSGQPVSFEITVTNHGPSDATGVTVTDPLPAQLTGATATPSQGTCTISGSTVTCDLGTMAVNATATVTVDATIAQGTSGQVLSNTASVSGNETDHVVQNDLGNVTGKIEATVLAATKTTSTQTVKAGSDARYQVAIAVTGPADATDVTACDVPPPHTTYVSVDGASIVNGQACWHFATLAAGSTTTRDIVLRVDANAPAGLINNLLVVHGADAAPAHDGAGVTVKPGPGTTNPTIPIVTG